MRRAAPISTRRRSSARWRSSFSGADVATLAAKSDEIFAANRALARSQFAVKSVAGKTRRAHVHEAGSLRVRCPGAPAEELEAVLINTAGGVAGGDASRSTSRPVRERDWSSPRRRPRKSTARSDPNSVIDVKLKVAAGASLAWLPQETILFDRARLRRSIDVGACARMPNCCCWRSSVRPHRYGRGGG